MPSSDKKLVLIVDDEAMDIGNMREILEGTGKYSVCAAVDYHDAVLKFERRAAEIDLALIDVALPGKNGVELAKRLITTKPDLQVIFVSGHVGASVIRFYGINAGDDHFVQKPLKAETLLKKVEYALASREPLEFILSARGGAGEEEPPTSGD